ncbi:UDP-galactopyranose mutase [Altererythrobacter sp. TH136]|uniref:UDP-galactopyranose mutase n=1 Tax=Altererythrobacter sp. TH136 TaxID=2067415 RepID=UPI001FEFBC07|nr:UDP-galactopyranose mutase [Altererythrobacter sp. TH136]
MTDKAMVPGERDVMGGTLICFSHLRWNFVFQRPQHLMTRLAQFNRVFFWEEPIERHDGGAPELSVQLDAASGVTVITPQLPAGLSGEDANRILAELLDNLATGLTGRMVLWYYTPMMLPISRQLNADCVVYDCMDELANFRFAPPELLPLESELIGRADLVFTGGYSLYEAKRDRHARVHPFPSSVDGPHFAAARAGANDPADQAGFPRPRLGFYGVIDERLDLELLATVADARPDWSLVMVGPVVKISEDDLPRRPNIHYLGGKDYTDLPAYLSGWDAALMPFAINDATKFISPTKTPEYLAAGRPVVCTPITDVVRHYGELEGVFIAGEADAFIDGCEKALALGKQGTWLDKADRALATMDWDRTVTAMWRLVDERVAENAKQSSIVSPRGLGPGEDGYDVLIVGAGFAGAVMAERFASQEGKRVLVVDRRPHIAGNAYDKLDDAGVLIHQYGPHIFHTNSAEIFDYLSQFTSWRPYEHRVLAQVDDQLVPMPINRTTLNMLYGLDLKSDADVEQFLAARAEPLETIETSEDVVVAAVGRELYETFFRGYTRKQWGLDPSELDRSVTARVPTRTNTDDRYFTDRYQFMPANGYTAMFERMLDHPNIDVLLGTDYREIRDIYPHAHLVYTGPIDEFFDHRFGKLPYRSLRFEHETLEQEWYQETGTVNYPDEAVPFTRISEYKYLTGQDHPCTSVTREYPAAEGDPYYPIPRPENQELFKRYEALARARTDVTFVGRLATYRYYNMDQIVGQALASFRRWQAAYAAGEQRELIATAA